LGQSRRRQIALPSFLRRGPQLPNNPFRNWSNRTRPHVHSFGQKNGERRHQTAVSIPLLKEPFPTQWLTKNPIEDYREHPEAKFVDQMGNPVEGERDSGLKPNTIPL